MPTPKPTSNGSLTAPNCSREEMLEHVMRATDDDLLALSFLGAGAYTRGYLSALGRLISVEPITLPAGSPLRAWAAPGHTLNRSWRVSCTPSERSLWGELDLLSALCGSRIDPLGNPLELLLELRNRVSAD